MNKLLEVQVLAGLSNLFNLIIYIYKKEFFFKKKKKYTYISTNECRAAFTERNTHSIFSFLFLKKEQGNSTGARWFLRRFFIVRLALQ